MLIEGNVYGKSNVWDGSLLVKIRGPKDNLLMWQNIKSGKYGVHLYEKSPEEWDEDFLLYNYRKDRAEAEKIFKKVEKMITPKKVGK